MFELAIDTGIASIVINRGSRRNAVPMAEWAHLEKLVRIANTSEAHVIVIKSADPKSFCAGSDLTELNTLVDEPLRRKRFRGAMESVFKRIRAANKPTVCLIRGGCFGTGVSLATACDIRVAHPDSQFAVTPARFGISYPQEDLRSLVGLVGSGQAARLVYGCDVIDGHEAYRIKLAELLDEDGSVGEGLVERIASNAPSSLNCLKATLLGRFGLNQRFDASFGTEEFKQGIRAFNDRGVPEFRSR